MTDRTQTFTHAEDYLEAMLSHQRRRPGRTWLAADDAVHDGPKWMGLSAYLSGGAVEDAVYFRILFSDFFKTVTGSLRGKYTRDVLRLVTAQP